MHLEYLPPTRSFLSLQLALSLIQLGPDLLLPLDPFAPTTAHLLPASLAVPQLLLCLICATGEPGVLLTQKWGWFAQYLDSQINWHWVTVKEKRACISKILLKGEQKLMVKDLNFPMVYILSLLREKKGEREKLWERGLRSWAVCIGQLWCKFPWSS